MSFVQNALIVSVLAFASGCAGSPSFAVATRTRSIPVDFGVTHVDRGGDRLQAVRHLADAQSETHAPLRVPTSSFGSSRPLVRDCSLCR